MSWIETFFGTSLLVLASACGSEATVEQSPPADGGSDRDDAGANTTPSGSDPAEAGASGAACGWEASSRRYTCKGSGADPSGASPRDCPTDAAPARECSLAGKTCCAAAGALACNCPTCEGCTCRWQRADCL